MSQYTLAKLVWSVVDVANEALKQGRRRVGIILVYLG